MEVSTHFGAIPTFECLVLRSEATAYQRVELGLIPLGLLLAACSDSN